MANAKEKWKPGCETSLRTGFTQPLYHWISRNIREMIHNPNFNWSEFDHFKSQAGLPSFVMSAGSGLKTNAIGLVVKRGKYGGTYAFRDIAFEFGTAISVPFKLYLIEEFQQLKTAERKQTGWSAKRELSKINYRIHTNRHQAASTSPTRWPHAGQRHPCRGSDVLNVAIVGITRQAVARGKPHTERQHPRLCHYQRTDMPVEHGKCQCRAHRRWHSAARPTRVRLNQVAIQQMRVLASSSTEENGSQNDSRWHAPTAFVETIPPHASRHSQRRAIV